MSAFTEILKKLAEYAEAADRQQDTDAYFPELQKLWLQITQERQEHNLTAQQYDCIASVYHEVIDFMRSALESS